MSKITKRIKNLYKKYDYLYKFIYANVLANSYNELEDFEKSANYFRLNLIATHTADAKIELNNGNYSQALAYYKTAIEKDIDVKVVPYNYCAYGGIIDLLFDMEKYSETKEYIQKAIKICKRENNKDKLLNFPTSFNNSKDNPHFSAMLCLA